MEIKKQNLNKLLKTIEKDKHKLVQRKHYNNKYIKLWRRTKSLHSSSVQVKNANHNQKLAIEGHRGVGMFEVHNSLSSFKKSIEMKQDYVELDTWLTIDGVVVVVHGVEAKIKDKDGQLKEIEQFTSQEITQIVLNEKGDRIPTLEEVFDVCKDKIKINIELKGTNKLLPDGVMQVIKKKEMELQVYLSAFYHPFYELMLEAQRKYEIETFIKFAFLFSEIKQFPDISKIPKGNQLNFSSVLVYDPTTISFVTEARKKGLTLSVYFGFDILETEQIYKRLVQIGVSSIITNQPHTLRNFRFKYFNY